MESFQDCHLLYLKTAGVCSVCVCSVCVCAMCVCMKCACAVCTIGWRIKFFLRWYQVNYTLAEQLIWARGSGCGLATGSCGGYRHHNNSSKYSNNPHNIIIIIVIL